MYSLGQILGARYIDNGCNGMTGAKIAGAKTASPSI
jgi:hypothetical protein